MVWVIKLSALQLMWLGCVPIYCAARQQRLLRQPLPKAQAWMLFATVNLVALLLLSRLYHPLTAAIYALCIWMMAWLTLALWLPYWSKSQRILPLGSALILVIGLVGGVHVA